MVVYIKSVKNLRKLTTKPKLVGSVSNLFALAEFFGNVTSYYDISDKGVYTIKEGYMGAGKEIKIRDFTSETDWTGYDINDVTTTVYDLIRQNADIVKGVITGHIHAYTSSEIIGIDENGEPNGLTIPQYTGYSGMGAAMRITVK